MKLPRIYYEQINEAINRQKIPLKSFSFTKKRGWIYINHHPSDRYFSFFRKKSVTISSQTHQWESSETFKIKPSDGDPQQKEHWQGVMESLMAWLADIHKQTL